MLVVRGACKFKDFAEIMAKFGNLNLGEIMRLEMA